MEGKLFLPVWLLVSLLSLFPGDRNLFTIPRKISITWAHMFPLGVLLISGSRMNHLKISALSRAPFKSSRDEMHYSVSSCPPVPKEIQERQGLCFKRIWEDPVFMRSTCCVLQWRILRKEACNKQQDRVERGFDTSHLEHHAFNMWSPTRNTYTWGACYKYRLLPLPLEDSNVVCAVLGFAGDPDGHWHLRIPNIEILYPPSKTIYWNLCKM